MRFKNLTPRVRIKLSKVRRWKVRGLQYSRLRKEMPARKLNHKAWQKRFKSCMYSHAIYLMNLSLREAKK